MDAARISTSLLWWRLTHLDWRGSLSLGPASSVLVREEALSLGPASSVLECQESLRPGPSWIQAVGWDHQAERWAGADRAEIQHCREEWCDVVLLQLLVDLLYKKVTPSPRMLRVCPDSLLEPDQRFQPRYKCPPEAPLSSWPPAPTGSGWWCPGGPGYPTAAGW